MKPVIGEIRQGIEADVKFPQDEPGSCRQIVAGVSICTQQWLGQPLRPGSYLGYIHVAHLQSMRLLAGSFHANLINIPDGKIRDQATVERDGRKVCSKSSRSSADFQFEIAADMPLPFYQAN